MIMASRSVAVKVDWPKVLSKLSGNDVLQANKLKSKVNTNVIKASKLPEQLPKIDWAYYKENASDPKLVEQLEKSYANVKVSTPKAPAARLQELDECQKQDKERFVRYSEYANSVIESSQVVKKKFEDMIPVKDMTMEDWVLTFPYWSHSRHNPSIWPHQGRIPGLSKEEQIAWEQPEPLPYATPTAWKDWEVRKKKYYS